MPLKHIRSEKSKPISISYKDCWAKTTSKGLIGTDIYSHSVAVAEVSKFLLQQKSEEFKKKFNDILKFLPVLCAIHDVGKISPDFQIKSNEWKLKYPIGELRNYRLPFDGMHAAYSKDAFIRALYYRPSAEGWGNIVGAHHGSLCPKNQPEDRPPAWSEERAKFIEKMSELYGSLPDIDISTSDWIMLAGFIAICDWIASDEKNFPSDKNFTKEDAHSKAKNIFNGKSSRMLFGASFSKKSSEELFPFELNNLQKKSLEIYSGEGIYIIEAPMGMGKTEAALLLAHKLIAEKKASGIYFALPTRLTSNKIFERVRDFLKMADSSVVAARLAHGTSWLDDVYVGTDSEFLAKWFNSPRRALLFPFGVGTIDQALMSVIPIKHLFLRNAALSDKVVILDEIHSYDSYTSGLISVFIKRLRELGSTVIILSATLSKSQRSLLAGKDIDIKFPAITFIKENALPISLSVDVADSKNFEIVKTDFDNALNSAIENARRGLCVLFVCNTVRESQNVYQKIKLLQDIDSDDFELGLLHSKFPLSRRSTIEKKWLNALGKDRQFRPRNGCILVSTQIVEQSVDIDADLIVTELCPIDMLLQRMGRCFRHSAPRSDNAKSPKVYVIMPDFSDIDFSDVSKNNGDKFLLRMGPDAKVYNPYILLKTADLLRKKISIIIPGQIDNFISYVYENPPSSPMEEILYNKLCTQRNEQLERSKVISNRLDLPEEDDEHAKTRISAVASKECLLYQKTDKGDMRLLSGDILNINSSMERFFDKDVARIIHLNTVKIPQWIVNGVSFEYSDVLKLYLDNKRVLPLFIDDKKSAKINNICIKYSDEIGLDYFSPQNKPSQKISIKEAFENFTKYKDDE